MSKNNITFNRLKIIVFPYVENCRFSFVNRICMYITIFRIVFHENEKSNKRLYFHIFYFYYHIKSSSFIASLRITLYDVWKVQKYKSTKIKCIYKYFSIDLGRSPNIYGFLLAKIFDAIFFFLWCNIFMIKVTAVRRHQWTLRIIRGIPLRMRFCVFIFFPASPSRCKRGEHGEIARRDGI